jgi:hypothetical protein
LKALPTGAQTCCATRAAWLAALLPAAAACVALLLAAETSTAKASPCGVGGSGWLSVAQGRAWQQATPSRLL